MAKGGKDKLNYYIVFWEAKEVESGEFIRGYSEIGMESKWHPGEINGVLEYVKSLIGEGFTHQMITSVFSLGKFKRLEDEGNDS